MKILKQTDLYVQSSIPLILLTIASENSFNLGPPAPQKSSNPFVPCQAKRTRAFLFRYSFSGDGQPHSQLQAPAERQCCAGEKHGQQSAAKQQTSCEPAGICAFVGSQGLNTAVQYHGNHQNSRPEGTYTNPWIAQRCGQNPHKFPRAAGANRKPPPMIMERSVIPAMAAAEPGQPDIKPGDHCIMARPTPAATTTT